MKRHDRGSKGPRLIDPTFLEVLEESEYGATSARRQVERKTKQLCRQVQRALNLALADPGSETNVEGLFVEEVTPAPDCGRLLVRVLVPTGRSVAETMAGLGLALPRLRSEVASAITRKRAPQLYFVPVEPDGGGDE